LGLLIGHSFPKKRSVLRRKVSPQNSRAPETQPSGHLLRCERRIFFQRGFQDLSLSVHFGFLPLSDLLTDGLAKIGELQPDATGVRISILRGNFGALLSAQRIGVTTDPIALILHIAAPHFDYLDRGKGSVDLSPKVAAAVSAAVIAVTKEWSAIKRKQERDRRQAQRLAERLSRGRTSRITVKEAAYAAIPTPTAWPLAAGPCPPMRAR
jgi:hypothetical protein